MNTAVLAHWEGKLRPFLLNLPPAWSSRIYSHGRAGFLARFAAERPKAWTPPAKYTSTLWGLHFRAPIMNAAGMFKNGEAYRTVAMQGAGAYLAGTTTSGARSGNVRNGIRLPFVPYPRSGAASNWLGLPNKGHAEVAKILSREEHMAGCPIGASLMADPGAHGAEALNALIDGLRLYERAGVDFLEINESCPNVEGHRSGLQELSERLEYVARHFLQQRRRRLPVIVKFSTDTVMEQLEALLDVLFTCGFDGVNFGNTSTAYAQHREHIAPAEHKVYDYFTTTFGGGVSGRPLRKLSLELAGAAVRYAQQHPPAHEFHVIRTGGIESRHCLEQSYKIGVALNQWYTGYFEAFSRYGHSLYSHLLD